MEPVYTPVIGFARTLFAAQGLKFTILGDENVPTRGGAVMVINHTGYFDFAYAGLAAHRSRRLVRFMAKDSVFHHPVSGPLMRGMKHIPVDRAAGAGSYAAAVAALRAGEIVGVFPEATISRSFELKDFKNGAARMASDAGVPILPLVIWGSHRVWTKGLPRRLGRTNVPILMSVGEPIPVPAGADMAEVTARYKAVMAEMLDVARAAYEPLTGPDLKFLPAALGGTAPTLEEATRLDREDAAERIRLRKEERARKVAADAASAAGGDGKGR
jgi:1-acyl-sn-glycerol-3-phosphate acyltransferase